MTIPVSLNELVSKAATFGPFAYIITSAGTSSPRVTHIEVVFDVDQQGDNNNNIIMIRTKLGKSACRELQGNPNVTVLWHPPAPAPDDASDATLSLIVDGHVESNPSNDDGEVCIVPITAILHRRRTITS